MKLPNERTHLLKDADALKKLDDDSTEICTDNTIKLYARRPYNYQIDA